MSTSLFENLNLLEKAIALCAGAGLAYTTYSANTIQNDLTVQRAQLERVAQEQERQIELRQEDRELRKQQNDLTQTIFQEFVKAITDQATEPGRQLDRLEGVLVLTYAIPDARQQEGMGRAVQKAMERIKAPEVAERVQQATFDAEELVARAAAEQRVEQRSSNGPATNAAVRWGNYDFDVFWCDGVPDSPALQAQAGEILALKSLDATASGRWRPRPLPSSVNDRPGYRIAGSQIRYSSADEKRLAELLKSQIEAKYPPTKVEIVAANQNTPWYLSVFVCP